MSKGQLKKHKDKLKVFLAEKAAKEGGVPGGGAAVEEKKEEAGGDDALAALEAIDTTGMSAGQLKKHK